MRHVELLGLPGCGKSSIARRMEQRYGWVGVREARRRHIASLLLQERIFHRALQAVPRERAVRRVWPRFEELGAFVCDDADALAVVARALAGLRADQQKVTGQLFRTLAEIGSLRHYSAVADTSIHDEGIQQRRVSLTMRGATDHGALSRLSPEATRIVLIDVPHDLAAQRLRRRGHPRRDTSISAAALDEVLSSLGTSYVTVDGTSDLDSVCDALRETVDG